MARLVITIPPGNYENETAVDYTIRYILRLDKWNMVGGCGVTVTNADDMIRQFDIVKRAYGKTGGKQVMHIVFSLDRTMGLLMEEVVMVGHLISRYFGKERQVVFAVHDDTPQPHIHMVINTVSYVNGEQKEFFDLDDLRVYANRCVDAVFEKSCLRKPIPMELYM